MNPQMIRKLQKMQREKIKTKKELDETVFTGSAGGMVTVEVKGNKEIVRISINKDASLEPDDLEMLEDTIVAALNNVMEQIDQEEQERMGQFTGGAGLGGFGF